MDSACYRISFLYDVFLQFVQISRLHDIFKIQI